MVACHHTLRQRAAAGDRCHRRAATPDSRGTVPRSLSGCRARIPASRRGDEEIWVRCDSGPLGFLSIAAHGHADALSVEVRHGGVEILADPGTYCYHGDEPWRRYFKATRSHNTLEVDGIDQADFGGPFLWLTHPEAVLEDFGAPGPDGVLLWQARHHGYCRLPDAVTHHRCVQLDPTERALEIEDWIEALQPHRVLLAFHLGPQVKATIEGAFARLSWRGTFQTRQALMTLPPALAWDCCRGQTSPPLGWYSRGFGHREPSTALLGEGTLLPGTRLASKLTFSPPPDADETED